MKTMSDRTKDWREGKKAVCFFMDAKEHTAFRHRLMDEHKPMSQFFIEMIRQYLAKKS